MPIFKNKTAEGKPVWTRLCELCGRPFIKESKSQKKCLVCISKAKKQLLRKILDNRKKVAQKPQKCEI